MSKFKSVTQTKVEELVNNSDTEEVPKRQKIGTKRTALRVVNPELKYYDAQEKSFYNSLDDSKKVLVAALETAIKCLNEDEVPTRFKILLSNIDDNIKAIAIKKLQYLYDLDPSSSEYYKIKSWIESLCKLPIGKYINLPVNKDSPLSYIREFVKDVRDCLDDTVYGHKDAKHQIIRLIAQWISNPQSKGLVIGIHGPAGMGKTSLIKNGICKALGLPFAFIALGGASDGSYLDGHSYTYEGSTWGKIVDILMKCGCMNPVLYFDELDKVSFTHRGEEICNILIHLTDSSQNEKYSDKYFTDIEFDLSRCLLIFSYNDESLISPILKDRMIKIKTEEYKIEDKVVIAQNYLLKELREQFKFRTDDVVFSDSVIKYIINNKIEKEEGVRNLKRALESILSNINLNMLLSPEDAVLPFDVTDSMVDEYVPAKKEENKPILSMYI